MKAAKHHVFASLTAAALGLSLGGCCNPSQQEVRDATKHISDSADALMAAETHCRNPPAGQDPAPFCAAVDRMYTEIKTTSDALGKRAQ